MTEYVFHSDVETQEFAQELASKIPEGSVVALIGNLGTGKTTFTQGFAKGLNIEDQVISPTFKLVSEYEGDNKILYHIDCYRLDKPVEFLNIGGEQFLNPVNGVTLIEWAERIEPYWSDDWIFIHFKHMDEKPDSRTIKITGMVA